MRRRDFLGKTLIGTAGIAIGASGIFAAACKGANNKVVLALIGAGHRGLSTIISTCLVNSNVEIKTVCDVNDSNALKAISEIEKQLGYKPIQSKNMKEVFDDKDIDAVWIATPDHWHTLATVWACQAGKDVYVEKTPGISIMEGRKMIDAAKKNKKIVQVGFQNRSAAYAASAREYISSGKLGQVVHIKIYNMLPGQKWVAQPDSEIPQGLDWDTWLGPAEYHAFNPGILKGWNNYWAYSPGTLNDASHQLDLTRMVMGDPGHPKSVFAWGGNTALGSERETPEMQAITYDFSKFTVTLDSGTATNYMKKTPDKIRMDPALFPEWRTNADRIEIYGTDGLMYLGRHGGGWQVLGPKATILAQEGGIHPDKEHQINFIESIRSNKKPNSDVEQAQLSAALVHFGNIAYRTGNKQIYFNGENEQFTDNDEANKLLGTTYRDNFKMPEKV